MPRIRNSGPAVSDLHSPWKKTLRSLDGTGDFGSFRSPPQLMRLAPTCETFVFNMTTLSLLLSSDILQELIAE